VVDAVRNAMSSSQQSEVKAWEEEITGCEHGLLLQQDAPKTVSSSGATCNACELSNNLWLCLTCGSLSCGRQQFGGTGGNGHALAHFEATAHPLAVKLGTITPEGTADVYCYACNDARVDHALQEHMATFGIHVADQVKTEKSMTELVRGPPSFGGIHAEGACSKWSKTSNSTLR
jgi:ubiquitin carboxyl-terminal hydrolase 5/13